MIDIHTHILPELDDGSGSIEESINMLSMLSIQGVGTIVATPHFYIDETEPEKFFSLRNKALKKLKTALDTINVRPAIATGAEFQFYPDIYRLESIEDFCISGTNYILLEMPFESWSKHTFQALEHLYTERNVIPIIAHLERYLDYQKDFRFINKIKESHSLIQVNSSFILDKNTRHKALQLIKKGAINFIASDSHNTFNRPPRLEEAFNIIKDKLDSKYIANLEFWEKKYWKIL